MTNVVGPALVVVAIALPLALVGAMVIRASRPVVLRVAPWAAIPAFVLAMAVPVSEVARSGVIVFGTSLGVPDSVTRGFLVLTASVWLASGLFAGPYMAADPRRVRFWVFFLASYTGNVGLVLARDVVTFYLFYALMTYAAFGLIVHESSPEARRAGRIYLVMALVGEMMLFAAFLVIVGVNIDLPLDAVPQAVTATHSGLVIGLLLAGFGIKAGALVLHVWLPLAHPVAPTPASAVLSGSMINAGLFGWLRFLPLGIVALPTAGLVLLVVGFAAAFYAVVVGLSQRDAKTILAYSSVSQMGFTITALGVALAAPSAAGVAVPAIMFYALHHALAKSSLFLGTGIASKSGPGWPRRLALIGLAWPALDIAGAPLSSGALAKVSLKNVLAASPWTSAPMGWLLSAGAVASTLIMAHLLTSVPRRADAGWPRPGLWGSWLVLFALDTLLFIRPPIDRADLELLARSATIISALWPVIAGAILFAVATPLRRRLATRHPKIPAGDLVVLFEAAAAALRRGFAALVLGFDRMWARLLGRTARLGSPERWRGALVRRSSAFERKLATIELAGFALVLLFLCGVVLMWTR